MIFLSGLLLLVDIAHTTGSRGVTGYRNTARSCFGSPKYGSCMFNDIDCTANGTNIIMIDQIVYTERPCNWKAMKKQCSSSEKCCDDIGLSHDVDPLERNLLDFQTYTECSSKPHCYHNFREEIVRTQTGLKVPVAMDVVYQCIEEQKIQHMCENGIHVGKQAHFMFNRQQTTVHMTSNCTCRVLPSPGQTFRLYDVDVRLQKNWQSVSNQNNVQHQCSKSALQFSSHEELECNRERLEFSTMMSTEYTEMSELDITLTNLVPDVLDNPMMVWLAVEGLNNSEVKVVCGAPNVFPEISWFQAKEPELFGENNMLYIIAASVVCACIVLIWCGCMCSRYMSGTRNDDTDDKSVESSATVPMLTLKDNGQSVLKDEPEKNDITRVDCREKTEGKVDIHSKEHSYLHSDKITRHLYDHPNTASAECTGNEHYDDIHTSETTLDTDQNIYAKPKKKMISSV